MLRKKARERVALSTGLAQPWGIEQIAPISHPEGHPEQVHMARLILFFPMMINPSRYAWKRLVPVFEQLEAGQPK